MSLNNICFDPFKNLNITMDSISPCCIAKTIPVENIDFVADPYLTSIRTAWLQGQVPDACLACLQAEEAGVNSRRAGSNQWYKDNNLDNTDIELIRLDYWTGDLCNLKCAICGPHFSSAWKQELGYAVADSKVKINSRWQTLDLSKLKFVHFNGGEPLLSKEHVEFLKNIPVKSQVHLNYNTNGTILPSKELLDLWSKFKLVQLDFSIDDIEDRFEYQRYPAKWNQIIYNLDYFKQNCPVNAMFAINTSIGILNKSNYPNLLAWLEQNFKTNRVTDLVKYRTQLTGGILSLKDYKARKPQIINYLDTLDSRRNTSWRNTFPELVELLT